MVSVDPIHIRLLFHNPLSQRSKTCLRNIETGDAEGNADNRQTAENTDNYAFQCQPKTGENNPDHIQNRRADTGIRTRLQLPAEGTKGKKPHAETGNTEGDADNCKKANQSGQPPAQPEKDAEECKPKDVTDKYHNSLTFPSVGYGNDTYYYKQKRSINKYFLSKNKKSPTIVGLFIVRTLNQN